MRLMLARLAGQLAGQLSRAVGRGRGETLAGRVTLAIDPAAMSKLARGRDIVLVSGTNGKTTTTAFLATVIAEGTGEPVSTSTYGANMNAGVVSVLAARPAHRLVVLECDELYVPEVYRATHPRVVVLLNLSRDQLHRTGEVRKVAQTWRQTFHDNDTTVIIDRDDPFLEHAVGDAGHVVRVTFGGRKHPDAATCPTCGTLLDWSAGDYRCSCGLGSLPAQVRGDRTLTGPGRNVILAVEAARLMGATVDVGDVVALSHEPPDRVTDFTITNRPVRTRLAKNPESWRVALRACQAPSVVLAVNARGIDGRDMSWVWDVDFSSLRGRAVVCTGDRRLDLAYRLQVQGVEVRVEPTVQHAVAGLQQPLEVIASYTAYQDLAAAQMGIRQVSGGRA